MNFDEYLKEIIDNIDESNTKGIAKKAIDVGFDNLSDKQQYVLKNGISDHIMEKCPNCEEDIGFEDMAISINNGRCPSCEYDWNKNYVD